MECSTELVPRVRPMSMGPYRMPPTKLIKLKKQVEELLKKQCIRPVYLYGVSMVKGNMESLGCVWTTGS